MGVFGVWIAYEEYFGENKFYKEPIVSEITGSLDESSPLNNSISLKSSVDDLYPTVYSNLTEPVINYSNNSSTSPWSSIRHGCIVFVMLSTAGVFMAIGALTCWHMKLITAGETCVETHINKKEKQRLSKMGYKFKNPYDLSPKRNWQQFLGFTQGKDWRHVLFPCKFLPAGDGLSWNMITQVSTGPSHEIEESSVT